MMAVNRYRLKHRAQRGERGAKLALALLEKTDTLLGVILLGNNLVNAGAATIDRGDHRARCSARASSRWRSARSSSRSCILVFSEITPKVIGAAHADRIAPVVELLLCADAEGGHAGRLVRQPVRAGAAQAAAHQAHERRRTRR